MGKQIGPGFGSHWVGLILLLSFIRAARTLHPHAQLIYSSVCSAGVSSTVWMKMQLSENTTTFFICDYNGRARNLSQSARRGLCSQLPRKTPLRVCPFQREIKSPLPRSLAQNSPPFVEEDALEIHFQRLRVRRFEQRFFLAHFSVFH